MKRNSSRRLAGLIVVGMLLASACAQAATQAPAPVATEVPATQAPAPAATEAPSATQGAAPAVIKIGGLWPLTGTDALNGQNPKTTLTYAVKEINDSGGIQCLGGAKLEMAWGDSQSSSEIGNSEMERLITQEHVVAVLGSYESAVVLPASEISEKYGVPYVVPDAIDTQITARGLKYIFMTIPTLAQWTSDEAKFVAAHGAKTGAVTSFNQQFGQDVENAWKAALPANGMQDLVTNTFPFGASDVSDTILAVKAANPDVWFLAANTQDAILFVKQMQELHFYPKMGMVVLGGFGDPNFIKAVGNKVAEGIILTSDWTPMINLPGVDAVSKAFEAGTGGLQLVGGMGTIYSSMWLIKDALEKSCSTDPKALANVLHSATFTQGKWSFEWPQVSFAANGQMNFARTVLIQYQSGNRPAIWPDDLKFPGANVIWPVPGWDKR